MICPSCMTHIPDDSVRCPACHANIGETVVMPRLVANWCSSCGSLVPEGQPICPSCGFPTDPEWGKKPAPAEEPTVPAEALPAADPSFDAEATRALPRIESAIPQEPETPGAKAETDPMPRTRVFVLASLASALLVCGVALALSHPWAPGRRMISGTEATDTSMAGFPGRVDALKGQDGGTEEVEIVELSADEATYLALKEAYDKLGELSEAVDANEARFDEVAYSTDPTERANGGGEAETLAIETSNLIDSISRTDTSSGTYVEAVGHLSTLGNWLRNRLDALCAAWKVSVEASDPEASRSEIEAARNAGRDSSGENAYASLFAKNYADWAPQEPSE